MNHPPTALSCTLLLALVPSAAFGQSNPPFDAAREQRLVDNAELAQPLQRGGWQATPLGLQQSAARAAGREDHPEVWLSGTPLADGTLRFVYQHQHHSSLAFMARAQRGSDGVLSGVGVGIHGRFMRLVRFATDGALEPLGSDVYLGRVDPDDQHEVVLSLFGPHLLVNIYDASSGEHLATSSANGVSQQTGAVGVVDSSDSQWRGGLVKRITVRVACQQLPAGPAHPDNPQPRVALAVGGDDVIKLADVAQFLERAPGGQAVWRSDPVGLEKIFCRQQPIAWIESELPWKYRDPAYLRARDSGQKLSAGSAALLDNYKNNSMVEQWLRAFQRRFPKQSRLEAIGRSHHGEPIWSLRISADIDNSDALPAVLLNGSHHGNELPATEFVLDAVATMLETPDPQMQRWLSRVVVHCIPLVNPDGAFGFLEQSARAGRRNGRTSNPDEMPQQGLTPLFDNHLAQGFGVDLNRNYPFGWERCEGACSNPASRYYRGPSPGSEPETQAVMALAEREHFVAAVSFHIGTVKLLAPYTLDGIDSPAPNTAWQVAEEIASRLLPHASGRKYEVAQKLYSVQGTDQDWLRHSHGTVALLVEGGFWPPPIDRVERARLVESVRPTWIELLRRVAEGPAVQGQVIARDGTPMAARVSVEEVQLRAGERWQSRRRDGRFTRLLGHPGWYTLHIEADGYAPVVKKIRVGSKPAAVEIRLVELCGDECDASSETRSSAQQ